MNLRIRVNSPCSERLRRKLTLRSARSARPELSSVLLKTTSLRPSRENAESLIQAREYVLLFQALLDAAQKHRISMLREIKLHRSTANVSIR
jgi:hypothetical protein